MLFSAAAAAWQAFQERRRVQMYARRSRKAMDLQRSPTGGWVGVYKHLDEEDDDEQGRDGDTIVSTYSQSLNDDYDVQMTQSASGGWHGKYVPKDRRSPEDRLLLVRALIARKRNDGDGDDCASVSSSSSSSISSSRATWLAGRFYE